MLWFSCDEYAVQSCIFILFLQTISQSHNLVSCLVAVFLLYKYERRKRQILQMNSRVTSNLYAFVAIMYNLTMY